MVALIEARDVHHSFGGQAVLALDALTLHQGEQHLLLGPSGCGKTTLLHILCGLLLPDRGQVRIAGQELTQMRSAQRDRLRGQRIGLVFQNLHLMGSVSVLQNLALARHFGRRAPDRALALRLLDQLGLSHRAEAMPAQLSQGEAQRVAIARALVNQPDVLIADEPTSSLDDAHAHDVIGLLQGTAEQEGAALLIVTHDQRLKDRFASATTLTPPSRVTA